MIKYYDYIDPVGSKKGKIEFKTENIEKMVKAARECKVPIIVGRQVYDPNRCKLTQADVSLAFMEMDRSRNDGKSQTFVVRKKRTGSDESCKLNWKL